MVGQKGKDADRFFTLLEQTKKSQKHAIIDNRGRAFKWLPGGLVYRDPEKQRWDVWTGGSRALREENYGPFRKKEVIFPLWMVISIVIADDSANSSKGYFRTEYKGQSVYVRRFAKKINIYWKGHTFGIDIKSCHDKHDPFKELQALVKLFGEIQSEEQDFVWVQKKVDM